MPPLSPLPCYSTSGNSLIEGIQLFEFLPKRNHLNDDWEKNETEPESEAESVIPISRLNHSNAA